MTKLNFNKKKIILVSLASVLIILIAIGGTLAYFTDFDQKKNTFTIGKVGISLDEPSWTDEAGDELRPGNVCYKDPTVTAENGQSYMRIRMEIVDGDGVLIEDTNRIDLILKTLYYDKMFGAEQANLEKTEIYTKAELKSLVEEGKINEEYNRGAFAFAGIEQNKPGVRFYNYIANGGIFDAKNTPSDKATLFTNVVIPRDWNNREIFELGGDLYDVTENGGLEVTVSGNGYKLLIEGQAIQASEMSDANHAFAALNKAYGVTIDSSGI